MKQLFTESSIAEKSSSLVSIRGVFVRRPLESRA